MGKYPLITSRKQAQFAFANSCILQPDLANFIINRQNKYNDESYLRYLTNYQDIPYFSAWLSGFIEGEGNFKLVRYQTGGIKSCSFNIGQNKDLFVLNLIKSYFNSNHTIYNDKKPNKQGIKHFRISISGKPSLALLTHFKNNPLLGSKAISYSNWINNLNKPC